MTARVPPLIHKEPQSPRSAAVCERVARSWRVDHRNEMRLHGVVGLGAALVLMSLFLCQVQGESVVTPFSLRPLPNVCYWRMQLGLPCPGCGMTRGVIHTLHGGWREGLMLNAGSLLMVLLLLLQPPLRGWSIWKLRQGRPQPLGDKVSLGLGLASLIVSLAQWGWRLLL